MNLLRRTFLRGLLACATIPALRPLAVDLEPEKEMARNFDRLLAEVVWDDHMDHSTDALRYATHYWINTDCPKVIVPLP